MISYGIKASELIKLLEDLIKKHGDNEVYHSGQDYPEGVKEVHFILKKSSYVPSNSFKIY